MISLYAGVLLLSGTLVAANPSCTLYANCEVCAAAAAQDCGWCNGQCMQGTDLGPSTSGACSGSTWHWHGMNCPAAASCSSYGNCDDCGSKAGCGWCNGACHAGTSGGPTSSGRCDGAPWHWQGNMCPPPPPTPMPTDPCSLWSNCSACTDGSSCGWCNGMCILGNFKGPLEGSCDGFHWHYEGNTCDAPPAPADCSQWDSCDSCTNAATCGWCDEKCTWGNKTGPHGSGSCGTGWRWEGLHCPATTPIPANDCTRYTTCDGCTSDASECGWCDGSGCQRGNATGPLNGMCARTSWHWEGFNCPMVPIDCSRFNFACSDCIQAGNCGWCDGQCLNGGSGGPSTGTCMGHTWSWKTCATPVPVPPTPMPPADCSQHTTCSGCTTDASPAVCGWCDGHCIHGNSSGPLSGSCSGHTWHWFGDNCPMPPQTPRPAADCSAWTDCTTCTQSPSGECGFCSATKTCSKGSSLGPSGGTCSGIWSWYGNSCN